jgi:hypothetical protein
VRQFVLRIGNHVALEIGNALFDLAFADVDALADFDAAQLADRYFLTQCAPEPGVVEAILGQQCRHFFERHAVLYRDVRNRLVEHLVGNPEADALGALQLDLGQDQALQNLLEENVFGRQLHALCRRVPADRFQLLFHLALEDDALVDDRSYAVEEFPRGREFVGEGRRRAQQHGGRA